MFSDEENDDPRPCIKDSETVEFIARNRNRKSLSLVSGT